jgi:hydroxymethylpyrimidine pyrophosphatase-like HAD family hydrolase
MAPSTELPRLIATDLDGTLLRRDGTVSPRTRRALMRARAAGIEIVWVTGRPPRHVATIEGAGGFGALVICINGAVLYDLEQNAIVHEARLSDLAARDLVLLLRAQLPGICFAVEVGLDYGWEPSYGQLCRRSEAPKLPLADALALCAQGVNKLIARHPDFVIEDLLARSRDLLAERACVSYSGAPFLEISAPEVSKASALARYCLERAIDQARVVGFGDMPNDLPMLEWAGYSVAMANAHESVLTATDEVTLSNEEDGVALVVERLLASVPADPCRKPHPVP